MLAFLFGATNLSPQAAALAWIFLGWQFALALVLGSVVHAGIMAVIIRFTYPEKMVELVRKDAGKGGMSDPAEGLSGKWRKKIKSREAWLRIGQTYARQWGMIWKDILVGFTAAGAVATLVPEAVFQAIFPQELSPILLVVVRALLGPVLWENGILFSGILAFLYADFVVIPAPRINAAYYGWRFAAYLGMVFAASAVGAGTIM
jgi:uncharacterized membrane protein YraQ (UPF0718 family)